VKYTIGARLYQQGLPDKKQLPAGQWDCAGRGITAPQNARDDFRLLILKRGVTARSKDATMDAVQREPVRQVRVAIVGAGFSGLGMAIRLKRAGITDFLIFERAEDLGGTWRDNIYPGCGCDVESPLYSFSFALNPNWTRLFASQREIWAYLRQCARRFGIQPHICWGHAVTGARWDDAARHWHITTAKGAFSATFLILGAGPLSEPSLPEIAGLDRFAGTVFHSARWDDTYDLSGKRVAVIGTGASAIQIVPRIQPVVRQLHLFQRTPPWIVPRLDRAISARQRALFRALPIIQRAQRARIYWQREMLAFGMVYRPQMLKQGEHLARKHLESQVADPTLRAKLTPDYALGCKRILPSDDFYPALTQPNVELVTDRVREISKAGLVTADGAERAVDAIIFATGFHVTDTPYAAMVRGRGGRSLAAAWQDGAEAYLGTTVAGFPNLFLCIGPNTGLGHSSMVFMIESQIAYVLDCLRTLRQRGLRTFEVRPEAQAAYNARLQRRMRKTVWMTGCSSWYLASNGRNTTIWPGFTWEYRLRTRRFDAVRYVLG
jgi:cation diffusion facilitator CzcD-associated flavoprotein CzcO